MSRDKKYGKNRNAYVDIRSCKTSRGISSLTSCHRALKRKLNGHCCHLHWKLRPPIFVVGVDRNVFDSIMDEREWVPIESAWEEGYVSTLIVMKNIWRSFTVSGWRLYTRKTFSRDTRRTGQESSVALIASNFIRIRWSVVAFVARQCRFVAHVRYDQTWHGFNRSYATWEIKLDILTSVSANGARLLARALDMKAAEGAASLLARFGIVWLGREAVSLMMGMVVA